MIDKLSGYVFILLLVAIAFFYDYHRIAIKRPQSVHAWRQADGASLALNYAEGGMKFFQPEVHNLTSDNGTTGKSATSEIPLLYYSIAFLYKIFGTHEFIYRILNTLLFLTGLFYLFKGLRLHFEDVFWAMAIPLFLFASPLLAYYGNNFLSNTAALSMALVAWFFVFRYFKFQKKKDLWWMFLFFFLAGALKVTALFSFFALALIFLLEWTGIFRTRKNEKLFIHPKLTAFLGLLCLLPIAGWIFYARYYNELHTTTYFSTTLFPIWSLDKEGIANILNGIKKLWFREYYHPAVIYSLGGMFLAILLFAGRIPKILVLMVVFLFLEISLFVLLQFWTFRDHDYYTINMFILPVFVFIAFVHIFKSYRIPKIVESAIKVVFFIFLLFNILYTQKTSTARYTNWMNDNYRRMMDYYTITPVLRENGINREDTIISFSEFSHVGLYLMDQKGWSRYTDMKYNRGEPFYYNKDSAGVQRSIDTGAKYLVLNGFGDLFAHEFLSSFTQHLTLSYRNILVFEPSHPVQNFSLSERDIQNEFFCSAEYRDSTGKYFTDPNTNTVFENGNTQSTDFAFSGKNAVKLTKETPYGMTMRLKDTQHGESIRASVWKKGKDMPGTISIQTEDYQLFHKESKELTGRTKGDWIEMEIDIFVPYEIKGEDLKIFLFYPGEDSVYFDDFRVRRYRSVLTAGQ